MRSPARRHRQRPLVVALYLNAGLLACLLVAVLSRSGGASAAMAGPSVPPIAGGGGGMFMMPGQFASTNWGCYLLDVDRQTLCVYEYMQGTKQLKLVAARNVQQDRELVDFNTSPSPDEIRRINQLGKAGVRGKEPGVDGTPGPATRPDGQPGGDVQPIPRPADINNPSSNPG